MTRTALALLAAAGALLVSGAAQAKAPPDGIDVCGASACTHLAFDAAEQFWVGAYAPGGTRAAPAPFYVLHWHWAEGDPESAYFIPSAAKVRWNSGNGHRGGWSAIDMQAAAVISKAIGGLEPNAVPTLTRVTVGGRAVRDPQTYVRLLDGKLSFVVAKGPWLRVTFESATPSPWTDGSAIVRLSKRQPYVGIDGLLYRIPRDVAVRARRAQSLG